MNTEPEKYTTEEINGWLSATGGAHHPDHPAEGIAAWKACKLKGDDAEWLRQQSSFFREMTVSKRLKAIADRLEAQEKRNEELEAKSANDEACIAEHRKSIDALIEIQDKLQKRVWELEGELAKLQDPVAVHMNMLRGTIAWTPEHLRHLLGDYAQSKPQPDADGWIPHKAGDPMPCGPETKVNYKVRSDSPNADYYFAQIVTAGTLIWSECGDSTITHWRPAK